MSSNEYSGYSSYFNFGDGLKKKIIIVSVASVVLLGLILGFLFGSGALTTDGDDGGDVRGNLEGLVLLSLFKDFFFNMSLLYIKTL